MSKKIAVVLAGCGVLDGSEIHEATLLLLAIKRAGCGYQAFAPDILQFHVINHLRGMQLHEQRNVLVESARIVRGEIKPLSDFNADEYDALVLPGGFGAVKNLCDYAFKGEDYAVLPELEEALVQMHRLKKPIGAMCIAPILLARVFKGCEVTLGPPGKAADAAEHAGANHRVSNHTEVVVDKRNKLATTPGYMLDADIVQIADGATNLINVLVALM